MKVIKKYTGDKTYMFPNGAIATPEIVYKEYPAVQIFPHIIETDESEEMIFAIQNLSSARSMYSIDASLSEEEAILAIQEKVNNPAEVSTGPAEVSTGPTAEERQAAALEAIADGQTTENAAAVNALLNGEG